ncbi:MAG: riboflavin synthase [Thermodesulfobacteriota bacterium]
MFTGLIEGVGTIKKIGKKGGSMTLFIESNLDLTETKTGDSISVDGVCLTIVEVMSKEFRAEVSPETLQRTTLREIKEEQKVNLERAMRISDRLGGHLVLGHVDGIGKIREVSKDINSTRMKISASKDIMKYIIEKGSVAIDGISLTVNECTDDNFGVNIIPHTAGHTTLSDKKAGDSVNIENDIIGKYVERFLDKGYGKREGDSKINREFLSKHGFT